MASNGHVGTSIAINARRLIDEGNLDRLRARCEALGWVTRETTDEQLLELVDTVGRGFRDNAPTTSEQAASISAICGLLAG